MRLKNILLVVEDVERSRRFYEELFGLHVIAAFDGNMILTEGLVLQDREIWEKLTGKKVKNAGNNAELYFEENELTKFAGKLEESDWSITYVNPLKEESGGQQVIRIYDPDGHLIEIGESLEHAEKRQKENAPARHGADTDRGFPRGAKARRVNKEIKNKTVYIAFKRSYTVFL